MPGRPHNCSYMYNISQMTDTKEIQPPKTSTKDASAWKSPFLSWTVHIGMILCVYAAITLPFLPDRLSLDNDSYLFLRQTEFFAGGRTDGVAFENGRLMDRLSYHPAGRNWLAPNERILLPRILGGIFRIFGTISGGPFSADKIETAFLTATLILAGLFLICAYVFARRLIGASGALWAGLLLATSPAVFTRIWPGSCSKEALAMPLIVAWLFAAGRSLKARSIPETALWAGCAGLLLNLAGLAWGGNIFFLDMFILFGLAALPFAATVTKALWGWPLVVAAAWLWSWPLSFIGPGTLPFRLNLHTTALVVVCVLWSLACLSSRFRLGSRGKLVLFVAAAVGAVLILIRYEAAILGLINLWRRSDLGPTRLTVLEYRPLSLRNMAATFGPALIMALPGGVWAAIEAFRRRNPELLFLVIWLLMGLVGAMAASRLVLTAAVPVAVCAALLWLHLRPFGKGVRFAAYTAIALALAFNASATLRLESREGRRMLPRARAWRDAGCWIRENTPANSVIVAWWDEGYFLQTLARRATIVDPGNIRVPVRGGADSRNIDVARMLMGDEARFKALISPYNPQDCPLYIVVTRDDLGKALTIAAHARELWPVRVKAGSGPLLARLLPVSAGGLGTPPPSFEPVYGKDGIFAYYHRSPKND